MDSFKVDILEYGPRWKILEEIGRLFPDSKKILFSENPQLFKDKVLMTNKKLLDYFDDIILSCDYGVLKIEQGKSLFDIATNKLKLNDFKGCVLIDDKYENCNRFRELGGHYINFA